MTKNKKKSILLIILVLLIISLSIILLVNINWDNNDSVISTTNEITENNNTTEVTIKISDLKSIGDGINAFVYEFSYDKSDTKIIEIKGSDNWKNLIYNDTNDKVIVTGTTNSNSFINQKDDLFKIVFNSKKDNINFKKLKMEVAAKKNNKTIKVKEKIQ